MKKRFLDLGGILIFYFVLVVGVLLLNLRFSYLNKVSNNNTYIGINN